MLRNEDLAAAVKAGVITADQQKALEAQASGRHGARAFAAGRDERFRFLKGFNDVFLSLGVLLVAGAFLIQWSPSSAGRIGYLLAGALALWALSEVLVARYKAVLPGMVAVLGIGVFCTLAGSHWAVDAAANGTGTATKAFGANPFSWPFRAWLIGVGSGGLGVLLYYLRFRLPFALLPLAYGAMVTALLAFVELLGPQQQSARLFNAVALILGLGAFALAMRFDASDPERLTRRSDCGFWLHLAAAPFIVHPAITMLSARDTSAAAIVTIAVVAVLGIVALIVDRRAILVSSLAYFGVAVGFLVTHATSDPTVTGVTRNITTTLLLLGVFVILMGLGWHRMRGLLLKPFAGARWLTLIPPVQPRTLA